MDTTTATLTLDGLTVEVTLKRTDDGPLLELGGLNCDLEGIAPGEYVLHPIAHAAVS